MNKQKTKKVIYDPSYKGDYEITKKGLANSLETRKKTITGLRKGYGWTFAVADQLVSKNKNKEQLIEYIENRHRTKIKKGNMDKILEWLMENEYIKPKNLLSIEKKIKYSTPSKIKGFRITKKTPRLR